MIGAAGLRRSCFIPASILSPVAAGPTLTGGLFLKRRDCHKMGAALFELGRDAALSFSIPIKDGQVLATVGEAIDFVTKLPQERLARHYWFRAVVMLNTAVKRPHFLATATINLHAAVAMDLLLSETSITVSATVG